MNQAPSWRRTVFGYAFWMAFGASIGFTSLAGVISTIMIVTKNTIIKSIYGYYPPSVEEFVAAKAGWVALMFWALTFVVMLFYENELWLQTFRQQPVKQERTPRHPTVQMESSMRHHTAIARDNKEIAPISSEHAKALYRALERQEFKITKRVLKRASGADGKKYKNVDARYRLMMTNWNKWGWIDKWAGPDSLRGICLSEKGQSELAIRGGIQPHPPH